MTSSWVVLQDKRECFGMTDGHMSYFSEEIPDTFDRGDKRAGIEAALTRASESRNDQARVVECRKEFSQNGVEWERNQEAGGKGGAQEVIL